MALLIEQVRWLHGNKTRFSVGECVLSSLEDRRACTATTNPPFRNRAIRQDDCLCASLGRCRCHSAYYGRERERFAGRLACRDDAQDVGGTLHHILAR